MPTTAIRMTEIDAGAEGNLVRVTIVGVHEPLSFLVTQEAAVKYARNLEMAAAVASMAEPTACQLEIQQA